MIELYNTECIEYMQSMPDKSVDCIICDLPYGTTSMKWDCLLPMNELWKQYNRILKDNTNIVLFSSGLFSYTLYQSNPKQYKYKLIWEKKCSNRHE